MLEFSQTSVFLVIAAFAVIFVYLKFYVFNYWKLHKIPHDKPVIPLGNLPAKFFFGKISLGNVFKENYERFKHHPFHGFYVLHRPIIVINDPDLIRTVLVKDFSKFYDRGWFHNEKADILASHIFVLPGEKWKRLRGKLSPIFTSGKLKQMYKLLVEVSDEMIATCEDSLRSSDVLEVKDILARYTTDIISSIVYGYNCNSLKHPVDNEFRKYGIKTIHFGSLSAIVGIFIPEVLESLSMSFMEKDVQNFFLSLIKTTIDHRKKEKIVKKDFLNLLIQLLDHGEIEDDDDEKVDNTNTDTINIEEAAAQAFVFFIAGYETSSSTVTYCLLELAMNPDIQEKLQAEIDEVAETKGINYDSIMGMEYLDMVFTETLRKHPSVPFLNRICREDFEIPGHDFTVPKGMRLLISASGIHNNPEFYPDPEKFDPSRFAKENQSSMSNYVHLGFGEGPRYCIGKRFGLIQSKQAIVAMLKNYTFQVCEKTPIPVKYDCSTILQTTQSEIYLKVEKRK